MATFGFNDQIYAQEALSAFVATLTPISTFARDFSGLTAQQGNMVLVPRVDSVATTTFSYANNGGYPYEGSGGVAGTVTVNLDQHQLSVVEFTDKDVANSSAANWTYYAKVQGETLGKKVLQLVSGLFTTANYGTAGLTAPIAGYTRSSTVSVCAQYWLSET